MPQVALFVNEVSSPAHADDIEKNLGNLQGVQSIEVGQPEQEGHGPQRSLVKKITVTYDAAQTNPEDMRAELEDMGYTVTVIEEV